MGLRTTNDVELAIAKATVSPDLPSPQTVKGVAALSGVHVGHVREFLRHFPGVQLRGDGTFGWTREAYDLLSAMTEQPLTRSAGPSPLSIAMTGNNNVVQAAGGDLNGSQRVTHANYRTVLEALQREVNESELAPDAKRSIMGRLAELLLEKGLGAILERLPTILGG